MRVLKRLVSLKNEDRHVLIRAFFAVVAARLALCVMQLGAARRFVWSSVRISPGSSVATIVWAVKAVARFVPGATCLTQAIAVQALLARAGHSSRLEIGVSKEASRDLEAHAWVSCNNRIVIGGPEAARFTRLTAWEM